MTNDLRQRAGFAFAILALAACSSQPSGTLPPGTYRYESHVGNVDTTSTVTIARDAGSTVLHEETKFAKLPNAPPISVDTRLNRKTFSVESVTVANDFEGINPKVTVSNASAGVSLQGKPAVSVPAAVPGAPSYVDTNWVSTYLAVPAMIDATGTKKVNVYDAGLVKGRGLAMPFSVVASDAQRPDGVPSTDASVGLALHKARQPYATLWYDPNTFVVSAVQLGLSGDVVFLRDR